MTSIFIVRAENDGAPESYLCGAYPTEELAIARINALKTDEDMGVNFAWFDEVKVGPNGADCFESNR